ncbi:VanZ family protein [Paenibacillus xerothermodurans]|uniref:VanZ-like domain-containing protein n=1 Tax=Paenibacillus xerothermodurans TaxID=1977292 RepID=A0A2W1NFV4_PAEXE|nr:VanZ family protein [Paenibacillus xerothermodurans]PZE22560.1 hypothetical protein CBW46_001910 [Paenibacillus xerothermodurans]
MRNAVRWLPALVWMTVIYCLSAQTGDDLGGWLHELQQLVPLMQGFDWGHFVSYFILALTYAWGLGGRRLTWRRKALVVVLCVIYGLTDEYHQSFVPGRSPDIIDIRNDAIGAALAMLFLTVPAVRRNYDRWTGAKYY